MSATDHCEIIRPLLSIYIDEEASLGEAALVEAHIAVCARCASELAFLHASHVMLSRVVDVMPPAVLWERIATATFARPTWGRRFAAMLRPVPGRFVLGTAMAAGIVAAAVLLRRPVAPPRPKSIAIVRPPVKTARAGSAIPPDRARIAEAPGGARARPPVRRIAAAPVREHQAAVKTIRNNERLRLAAGTPRLTDRTPATSYPKTHSSPASPRPVVLASVPVSIPRAARATVQDPGMAEARVVPPTPRDLAVEPPPAPGVTAPVTTAVAQAPVAGDVVQEGGRLRIRLSRETRNLARLAEYVVLSKDKPRRFTEDYKFAENPGGGGDFVRTPSTP